MDPYRTLGVSRSCTREEVKEAFRARAAFAHPDHGGEDLIFIQLRAAHDQILANLDRGAKLRPHLGRSAPTNLDDGASERIDPAGKPVPPGWEEKTHDQHRPPVPASGEKRENYIAWFQRVSAKASRRHPARVRRAIRILGMIFLLYLIFFPPVALLFSVTVFILDLQKDARLAGWKPQSLMILALLAVNLGSLLPACLLVWRYGRE